MAFNLIDAVKSQFSNDLNQRIGNELGEDPTSVRNALPGAISAVSAGLTEQGSTEAGAQRLLTQLNADGYTRADAPVLGDEASHVGGLSAEAERGRGLVSGLFGNKLSGVADTVTRLGGFRNAGSSAKLLAVVAPVVMGLLGRQVRSGGLNSGSLMRLLDGQRSFIGAALPAGLGSLIGFGARPAAAEVVREREVIPPRAPPPPTPHRRANWVWPLALGALVIAGGYWLTRARREPERRPQAAVQSAPRVQPPTARVPAAPPPPQAQPLPVEEGVGGAGPAVPEKPRITDEEGLRGAFERAGTGEEFILEGAQFRSGSAALTARGEAAVDQLGAVLKDNPNARIRLEGYTDDTGSPEVNKALSEERANTVRDALVKEGIAANRVETSGLGAEDPVATNDTATGRAKNRRVEVELLER